MSQQNDNELGALWERKDKSGNPYLTGTITLDGTAYEIVCFLNQYKKAEKHPDYRVFKSKPRPDSRAAEEESRPREINQVEYPDEEINPDDIPF